MTNPLPQQLVSIACLLISHHNKTRGRLAEQQSQHQISTSHRATDYLSCQYKFYVNFVIHQIQVTQG